MTVDYRDKLVDPENQMRNHHRSSFHLQNFQEYQEDIDIPPPTPDDAESGEAESQEEPGGPVFQHFFNRFRRILIKICDWCCYNICVVIFMLLLVALIVNAHTHWSYNQQFFDKVREWIKSMICRINLSLNIDFLIFFGLVSGFTSWRVYNFYKGNCRFSNFLFVQFLVVKDTLNRMTKHDGVIGFMLFKITGGMAKIKVSPVLNFIVH